jgi:hypothetical protein
VRAAGLSILAVVLVSSLAGCAGASRLVTASRTRSAGGLSQSEFASIRRVLKASVPLDSGVQPAWIRSFDIACSSVADKGRLLTAFGRLCRTEVAGYEAQQDGNQCPSSAGVSNADAAGKQLRADRLTVICQARTLEALLRANQGLIAAGGHFDDAVASTVGVTRCRTVLAFRPAELAYYRKFDIALRSYAPALRAGASVAMEKAGVRFERLDVDFNNHVRTNKDQFDELMEDCA